MLTLVLTLALLSSTAAQATPITYRAPLSGLNEAPSNASPGTGLAIVTIDPLAQLIRVQVTFGSYDHTYDTSLASAYRAGFVTDAGSVALAEAALFDAIMSGRAYVNIHSSTYPGGEIRGFLGPPSRWPSSCT